MIRTVEVRIHNNNLSEKTTTTNRQTTIDDPAVGGTSGTTASGGIGLPMKRGAIGAMVAGIGTIGRTSEVQMPIWTNKDAFRETLMTNWGVIIRCAGTPADIMIMVDTIRPDDGTIGISAIVITTIVFTMVKRGGIPATEVT